MSDDPPDLLGIRDTLAPELRPYITDLRPGAANFVPAHLASMQRRVVASYEYPVAWEQARKPKP